MPNLTDVSGQIVGRSDKIFVAQIARTDTTAKSLFSLPANSIPLAMSITSPAVSNAATTATISVGKSGGTGVEILTTLDVKGATGSGQQTPVGPAASLFGVSVGTSALVVTGIYAETGAASSAGGPWIVAITVITND